MHIDLQSLHIIINITLMKIAKFGADIVHNAQVSMLYIF